MRNIENYSEKYLAEDFEYYQVHYRRKKILEQIDIYQPTSILEIGCGMEPLFRYRENIKYTIVEPSKLFCKNAEKLAADASNVLIVQGFFEEVADALTEKFDMVICSGLLHEVEYPLQLLEAIVKICTEGTIVHINVPNARSIHRLLAVESGIIHDIYQKSDRNIELQQNNVYDLEGLSKLVQSVGLEIESKGSYFIKPFPHAQMYKIFQNGILKENVLDGLYNIVKYMPELGSEIFVNCKKY